MIQRYSSCRRSASGASRLPPIAGQVRLNPDQQRLPVNQRTAAGERGSQSPLVPGDGGGATSRRPTLTGVSRSNTSQTTVAESESMRVIVPTFPANGPARMRALPLHGVVLPHQPVSQTGASPVRRMWAWPSAPTGQATPWCQDRLAMVRCMKGVGLALFALPALACSCSTPSITTSMSASTMPSTTKSSSASTSNPQTLSATLACPPIFAPGDSQPDAALVGKSSAAAKAVASGPNQTWRVAGQNGTCDPVTADLGQGRIDLWIINGRVVNAVREELPGPTSTT
jgi:hypothetical protein